MVTGLQIAILPVDFAISLSLLFSSSKSSKSSTDFERALPTFRGPILFIYWIGTEKLMTAVNGCSACDSYLLYQSVCSPLVYPSGTLLKVKVERVDKRCSKESLCQYQFAANYLCINRSVKAATNHFKKTYCVVPFLVLARSKTPPFHLTFFLIVTGRQYIISYRLLRLAFTAIQSCLLCFWSYT